ncbi:hypothetical protein JCGZ_22421 [Jatropha curcas]|uniref:Uncharacterized protein n=1 Tax=Jatropha curcas TaxID=180498 RepID=A0A067LHW6_JATCU|nr:hypothetical protein JCGZ_22421 [Jatropha curcas]
MDLGKRGWGRLGFGHKNPAFVPTLNPNLDNVCCIALGGIHSVALTSLGQLAGVMVVLVHWDILFITELLPRLVEGAWNGETKHIATSGTHTAAVTESGGGLSIPSKVKALPVPVATVSCGGICTMALTEDGQIWNWGANSNYELGRGDKVGGWKPKPIPSLEGGKVLSWGFGGHGQLGHPSIENQKTPTVIDSLADQRFVYIACGGSSSAAVIEKGKLYMWGNARDSQLGVPGLAEVVYVLFRSSF